MTEQDVQTITHCLTQRFGGRVDAEQVAPGRFRFAVVSPAFAGLSPLRRQDLVWETIDANVSREISFDVSLLLTFSPDEVDADAFAMQK